MCATARCWPHNRVFLDGVRSALMADPVYNGGDYQRAPEAGLKAFARVYAGWAYSQAACTGIWGSPISTRCCASGSRTIWPRTPMICSR